MTGVQIPVGAFQFVLYSSVLGSERFKRDTML